MGRRTKTPAETDAAESPESHEKGKGSVKFGPEFMRIVRLIAADTGETHEEVIVRCAGQGVVAEWEQRRAKQPPLPPGMVAQAKE